MEDQGNIGFVHPECAPITMGLTTATDDLIGRNVKVGFPATNPANGGTTIEHMWVEVKERQGNTLFGHLNSEPVLICDVQYEDPVQVDIEDVEQIYPPLTEGENRKCRSRRSRSRKPSSRSR